MRRKLAFFVIAVLLFIGGGMLWFNRSPSISSETLCLAKNVYWEAKGEPFAGKLAVAYVTLARAHDNRPGWGGETICGVVYSPDQFSWTIDPNKVHGVPDEAENWKASLQASQEVQSGYVPPGLTLARYYLNSSSAGKNQFCWFKKKLGYLATIGNHDFYRETGGTLELTLQEKFQWCMPNPRLPPKNVAEIAH